MPLGDQRAHVVDGDGRDGRMPALAEVYRTVGALARSVARAPEPLDGDGDGRRRFLATPPSRDVLAIRIAATAAVTTYVATLRRNGVPPERMLILVKDAVRDAASGVLSGTDVGIVLDAVVRWSIEAYYAT